MTKSKVTTGLALIVLSAAAVLFTGCRNTAGVKPADGAGSGGGGNSGAGGGGVLLDTAVLTLSPDKKDITVKVITADDSAVTVEGCTETELPSGTETELHAQDTRVTLKGKITELYCHENKLTALNVQGLSALKVLYCHSNQLTALNVQSLSALQWLNCDKNQLTALNVQGLSALEELHCYRNRLNAEAFIKIFNDLPERAAGGNARCCLYIEQTGEGNHTDFTSPAELKVAFENAKDVKHWKMYKMNTSWHDEEI